MATFETTRPAPFGAVTTFRIISNLDTMRAALVKWNTKRKTINALSQLSAYELEDIGLTRGDVDAMTR